MESTWGDVRIEQSADHLVVAVSTQQPFTNEPLFRAVDPISNDFFAYYYYGPFSRRGRKQREARTARVRVTFLLFMDHHAGK